MYEINIIKYRAYEYSTDWVFLIQILEEIFIPKLRLALGFGMRGCDDFFPKPKALTEGCFEDALRPSGNALGLLEPAVLELPDRRTPDGRPVLCHAEPFLPGANRPS